MRTTRVLAIVAILGIAFSFRASANVAYDSETTNVWFKVSAAVPGDFSAAPWTKPTDGEVSVVNSKIALDTDLDDPLIYTPTPASGPVATVTAQYTATANAATPALTDTPQAALAVIANGADTNWYGLVKKNAGVDWEKFMNVIPTVGETYTIHIDLNNVTHQIRYWVGDTILGTGWYDNPKSTETKVASVSFVGTGNIGDFGGDNITENGATYKGRGYATFDAALAVAQDDWMNQGTDAIVLYQPATYTVNNSGTIYVNANGRAFTISGGVYEQNGNTYVITANNDCEAKIGSTFYSTIEKAIAAATAGQTIIVNKALNKALTFNNASVTLDTNSKTVTCATLTVADGVTLTLDDALAVTDANVAGSVAGETLTVNGTLTGVNVAKLTFGNAAIFAYAGTKLAPTALAMGTALTITGLGEAAIGTEVITATGLDVSKITATLAEGLCLEVKNNTLTVVKEILATITASSETEGFDYTNGTVSVTVDVKPGKTATVVLTVVGWDGTTKKVVAAKPVTSGEALTWDVAAAMEGALTQGGAYTYTVEVMVDGKVAAVKSGEFTAAKWGADGAWFKADATTGVSVVSGGKWQAEPNIGDDKKYEVSDSRFDVMSDDGSNKFTRVDTKIAFETLVDDTPDNPDGNTVGGFVATTQGWMAFNGTGWVLLTGADAPAPVAGQDYVIRAEFDFAAVAKRMRFFVAEGEGDFFPLAVAGGSQWLSTGVANQETLKAVEFQGSGKLESIMATVADAALASVGGVEYDSMADALAAAGTAGANTITLLTKATLAPTVAGLYKIDKNGYDFNLKLPADWTYTWDDSTGTLEVVDMQMPFLQELTAAAITYGQTLAGSTLTGVMTNKAGVVVAGTFAWEDDTVAPNVADGTTNRTYAVTFTPQETTKYYTVDDLMSTVAVSRAELTVTATNVTVVAGNDPDYGYELSGFKLADTESVVSGTATYACDYDKTTGAAGTYEIRYADGLSADNYILVAAETPGTLTVVPAVAECGGKFYSTVSAAVADAAKTGTKVTVLADTNETVRVPENVELDTNGHTAQSITTEGPVDVKVDPMPSGTIVYDISVQDVNKVKVTVTDTSKEAVVSTNDQGKVVVTVQTSTAIMTTVAPDGSKALTANTEKLRAFLSKHDVDNAYTKAGTSKEAIEAALKTTGGNNLPLWQDYVLGIEPGDPIEPVTLPTGDTAPDGITLAIPAIDTTKYSGDYTIMYQVTGGKSSVVPTDKPNEIKVPLATGTYQIKAVFTAK